MRASRAVAWVWLALALAQLALASTWVLANVGKVPHYGDTRELLRTARTLEFVEGRTIGYPWILRGLHAALASDEPWGETDDWETTELGGTQPIDCVAPRWHGAVQLLQLALLVASLAWAIAAVSGLSRGRAIAVALLVTTDPWVLHHAFSLMADSLSLSASALTCGAWVCALRRGGKGAFAALFALHVANALLRYEKNLVLVAAAAGVALGAFVLVRRDGAGSPSRPGVARGDVRRRALLGLALSLAAFPAARAIDALREARPELFSPLARVLHSRVIYPHLEEVRPELSAGTQALFTPDLAEKYDRGALWPIGVLEVVAKDDPELVERLALEIAPIVWERHGGAIVADVVGDVAKYAVPAPALYASLYAWLSLDERHLMLVTHRPYEAAAVHHTFGTHEPMRSARLEVAAALLTGVGFVWLLAVGARGLRGARALFETENALRWLPTLAFVLANAAAFSLASNLFEIRYALLAHAALLALAYGSLLRWAAARTRAVTGVAPPS